MYPRINVWYAGLNSYMNANRPSTDYNWFDIIDQYDHPYIAHESGNWCVYPNFKEIDKYKAENCVVRAKNFEVFQEMLADNGLADLAESYLQASGHLQSLCWKAEFEAALRTPDFAGLQMLSLSDFPDRARRWLACSMPSGKKRDISHLRSSNVLPERPFPWRS